MNRLKDMLENIRVLLILRLLVGVTFIYAGVLKVKDPNAFADSIASYQLLPVELINVLALGLPVLEIAIGALLVVGLCVRIASFCTLILAGVFALALASALVRGIQVDCGCFGNGATSVRKMWLALGRDILLSATALVLYYENAVKVILKPCQPSSTV